MGRYGIGARVRDEDGDEGVIIDKRKGWRTVKYDEPLGFTLERAKFNLTVIDEPRLKIGDRVVATSDKPQGQVGKIVADDGSLYLVSFDTWRDGHDGGGEGDGSSDCRHWWLSYDEVDMVSPDTTTGIAAEPISAGDPLTLRAGGYYKLRNGDVVGPLRPNDGEYAECYEFMADYDRAISPAWMPNGNYFEHGERHDKDIVAEVPAPVITPTLTIEAGKFYRTRDGRKTLVIANDSDTDYPWISDINGWHGLDAAGKSCIGADEVDLVSEWVEPVAEPAQPKFKKGDRVIFIKESASSFTEGKVYVAANDSYFTSYFTAFERVSVETNDDGQPDGWLAGYFAHAPTDFQVGDVVNAIAAVTSTVDWKGAKITKVDRPNGLYPIEAVASNGNVGLFYARELELVRRPPATKSETVRTPSSMFIQPTPPLPAVGTKVTLTGTVTGRNPVDKTNINVVVDGLPAGRNSLGISPSALKAA